MNDNRTQTGAGLIELVLLISLVAVICLAAVTKLGKNSACKYLESTCMSTIKNQTSYVPGVSLNYFECQVGSCELGFMAGGLPWTPAFYFGAVCEWLGPENYDHCVE